MLFCTRVTYKITFVVFLILGKWHLMAQQTEVDSSVDLEVKWNNKQQAYYAGEIIELTFNTTLGNYLICHTAYGSYILKKETKHVKSTFVLPPVVSQKSGVLHFKLLHNQKVIYESAITILPNKKHAPVLETYFGPPSIAVDEEDYAMIVAIPTDIYDNPLPDNTLVKFQNQFLQTTTESIQKVTNGFSWRNYFSPDISGRMLLNAATSQSISKESTVEVYASFASNFDISFHRVHPYADGNQVVSFKTSVIKDVKGNVISDATSVNFYVKKSDGTIIYTQSSTVNGIATAQLLHPDKAESWQVTAYVNKMAKSKLLKVSFLAATTDFPVRFSDGNRSVSVGLIQSFLGQIIPDGTRVKMTIYQNKKKLETLQKYTANGMVLFSLKESVYASGTYSFLVEALGVQKKFINKRL